MNPRLRAAAMAPLDERRTAVIRLEGELGCTELKDVGAELFRQVARGRIRIVLDLSAVPHLDYRGLRPLMMRAELLQRNGGDVKLSGVSAYVDAILRAGGAHDAFERHRTVEEALSAFHPPRPRLHVA